MVFIGHTETVSIVYPYSVFTSMWMTPVLWYVPGGARSAMRRIQERSTTSRGVRRDPPPHPVCAGREGGLGTGAHGKERNEKGCGVWGFNGRQCLVCPLVPRGRCAVDHAGPWGREWLRGAILLVTGIACLVSPAVRYRGFKPVTTILEGSSADKCTGRIRFLSKLWGFTPPGLVCRAAKHEACHPCMPGRLVRRRPQRVPFVSYGR